jgi:hypothetical protein
MSAYEEKAMGGEHERREAEETLRLIASLPAPRGLEERVHRALRAAPRVSRVAAWPGLRGTGREWMRAAAAAAIVFVIAGGGWGVYRQVQPRQRGNRITVAPHATAGGFAGANAIRTPQTVNGPVLTHPLEAHPPAATSGKKKAPLSNGAKRSAAAKAAESSAAQSTKP